MPLIVYWNAMDCTWLKWTFITNQLGSMIWLVINVDFFWSSYSIKWKINIEVVAISLIRKWLFSYIFDHFPRPITMFKHIYIDQHNFNFIVSTFLTLNFIYFKILARFVWCVCTSWCTFDCQKFSRMQKLFIFIQRHHVAIKKN